MSVLLKRYIRLAVLEAADARIPNQLVPSEHSEEETSPEDNHVHEFAACGAGGGGNTLASGNIVGYSAPLGMDPDKLGRKKNASKKKRKK